LADAKYTTLPPSRTSGTKARDARYAVVRIQFEHTGQRLWVALSDRVAHREATRDVYQRIDLASRAVGRRR